MSRRQTAAFDEQTLVLIQNEHVECLFISIPFCA